MAINSWLTTWYCIFYQQKLLCSLVNLAYASMSPFAYASMSPFQYEHKKSNQIISFNNASAVFIPPNITIKIQKHLKTVVPAPY